MSVTITAAGLRSAFPEWEGAPDSVVDHAVTVANARPLGLYTDRSVSTEDEETHRRYLEASGLLFWHPYGRDMRASSALGGDEVNPYHARSSAMDQAKGAMYRVPGWSTTVS